MGGEKAASGNQEAWWGEGGGVPEVFVLIFGVPEVFVLLSVFAFVYFAEEWYIKYSGKYVTF